MQLFLLCRKFGKELFDRQLANNTEQVKAVHQIVEGSSRPAPYLVFGPPGTGKTVTVVEAIKQVCRSATPRKNTVSANIKHSRYFY